MPVTTDELIDKAAGAKAASIVLAQATSDVRNRALQAIARAIRAREGEILAANEHDCANASARIEIDRLRLTPERIAGMARDVEAVSQLADPVGEQFDRVTRPNGLVISKRRVPLGVVGVVYESRPNVTSDIAAICIKTGNAVVLRGGSEALASNRAIAAAIQTGLQEAGLPETSVQLITSTDRALVQRMLKLREHIDVIIPRGGAGLIKATIENATIPVIETGAGVCHTYVDRAADAAMATRIVFNAKVRRPTICNALDTLIVHRDIAESWLPQIAAEWSKARVEIRADAEATRVLSAVGAASVPASTDDFGKEFLSLVAAVKVVASLDDALEHIRTNGSGHSEAIVTEDAGAATRFMNEVDAAAVFVNASTQFTDGGEFGLGTEVGISTQKLHARGPMGLRELTTYKWVIEGTGQTRP
ncbi:MAG TPA: glutamate-5-semialdehyde dehydrogenase [Vicinamibacterales bacterium]|nr:glutamate-5-semialdehyde dehydrogenase [Vicinamibacterales bacterium]